VRHVVRRVCLSLIPLIGAFGCRASAPERTISRAIGHDIAPNKPGIAIVASGGILGWEHVTLLDSTSARYVTVTRRACAGRCAPLDSASGTLSANDVTRIYEIADSENVLTRRVRGAACSGCSEEALVTTAVFGNRRRTIISSDREVSPEVLGRVHVALAEAIRAARENTSPIESSSVPDN
jgi:hypothetical protein